MFIFAFISLRILLSNHHIVHFNILQIYLSITLQGSEGEIPFLTLLSEALAVPGEHTIDCKVCIYEAHFLLSSPQHLPGPPLCSLGPGSLVQGASLKSAIWTVNLVNLLGIQWICFSKSYYFLIYSASNAFPLLTCKSPPEAEESGRTNPITYSFWVLIKLVIKKKTGNAADYF